MHTTSGNKIYQETENILKLKISENRKYLEIENIRKQKISGNRKYQDIENITKYQEIDNIKKITCNVIYISSAFKLRNYKYNSYIKIFIYIHHKTGKAYVG